IRGFESSLFYDPLIQFFKVDHSTESLPSIELWTYLANISFRFWLNTAISLLVLWIIFRKKEVIKVSVILYTTVFVLLMIALTVLLQSDRMGGHLGLFYVRRFLIQPLFLLLLIPAFYFQKKA
ncbi:MAG: exosortase F system-associated protein, partial [Flavobacteriaceae bacterium]|nr:exosortase F system-associated protein [Flavobacteriaceae bacterium]